MNGRFDSQAKRLAGGAAALVALSMLSLGSASAAVKSLTVGGIAGFKTATPGQASGGPEISTEPLADNPLPITTLGSVVGGTGAVTTRIPEGVLGAPGLNHHDQRTADGGNQFSLVPPDQGMCAGNGYVIEAVNDAIRVRDARKNAPLSGVLSLNQFFGLPYVIDRTYGLFGPTSTDPKCAYDTDTKRFFVTNLLLDRDAATGDFTGKTDILIAVSRTSNPLQGFQIFDLNVTNDGDPVNHPGCPCLGDQPLIGLDKNGLYISTNEFSWFGPNFNGAQLYAMSKQKLAKVAAGGTVTSLPVVVFNTLNVASPDAGGTWYSVQPATATPNDDDQGYSADAKRQRGVEYFLSALDFFGAGDNRVAVWALTNTDSLQLDNPTVSLNIATIATSNFYTNPPPMTQKGSSFTLNANDDRMNQVFKYGNTLFGAVNTAITDPSSNQVTGISYWGIKPTWNNGKLGGNVSVQGYVTVAGNHVAFPSIAVNQDGQGMMAFSLTGSTYYPSAAMIKFSAWSGAYGNIAIIGAGVAPNNSFDSGPGGPARWGDYSAVADDNGNIWGAAEYIPVASFGAASNGGLANWGTYVWRYRP